MKSKTKMVAASLLAVGLMFAAPVPVRSEVLLDTSRPLDLYGNQVRLQPGDVVTINISENITVNNGVDATDKNTDETKVQAGTGLLNFLPAIGKSNQRNNTNTQTVKQSQVVTSTMTARVVSVEPNGNVVLEGFKTMHSTGRNVKMQLRAVARPQDILPDNTIASSRLSDVEFRVDGLPTKEFRPVDFLRNVMGIFF